jgi:N4-gp56 family major capsid protein
MAQIGLTEVSASSMAVIASIVQDTLKQESKLLPLVTDYSSQVIQGALSVSAIRRTQFAAADKAENTALTAQELTFAADTITLSKNKAIYAALERVAQLQATPNVESEIIMEMAKELALQVDKDIFTEIALASAAAPDHRLAFAGANVAQADLLSARSLLNIQSVPMDNRYLGIAPDQEAALLAISDFVRADAYGSAGGLVNGEIGRLYGMTVVMSNVFTAARAYVWHKSAVGFAQQMTPEYSTDVDLKNTAKEYLLQHIYGAKVLDLGKRQVLLGSAA